MKNTILSSNRHLKKPHNEGELSNPDAAGISSAPFSADYIKLTAKINKNIISELKFKASGCSYAKTGAGYLTTLIKDRDILESTLISEKDIENHFGEFPREKKYIPAMVVDSFRNLITNYFSSPAIPVLYKKDSRRAVVALSGGIDSSMAAKILKENGYYVIGVTLKLLPACSGNKEEKGNISYGESIKSAIKVANKLNIPHIIIDMADLFEDMIIRPFCLDYEKGFTPNPCVACNKYIKFGSLLKKIKILGAAFLATGHYFIIEKSPFSELYEIKKSSDINKDQSYFLWKLTQNQLARIKTPLGEMPKTDIEKEAKKTFPFLKNTIESQDICFIQDKDYHLFLQSRVKDIKEGPILDTTGNIIGKHKGYIFYTVGQRKGLGVSHTKPLYVKQIIPKKNIIIAGEKKDILNKSLKVKNTNFISGEPPCKTFRAMIKIRYNSEEAPAKVTITGSRTADITFEKPQKAITPGQSAVFYSGRTLLGGGEIDI